MVKRAARYRERMSSDPAHEPAARSHPAGELVTLPREECLQLLASSSFGRIAVNIGDGAPVIRPVNYMFDKPSQSVVFRTTSGTKLHALLRSAQAAFEIDGIDKDTRAGWSVILHGRTSMVTNPSELRRLEGLGVETWAPGDMPHWVHIRARTLSGRRIVPTVQQVNAERQ